jgi:predicted membrane-bound spermidine synthase
MFRLIGLLTCVSLAFIFPLFAYQTNNEMFTDAVISTVIGSIVSVVLLK